MRGPYQPNNEAHELKSSWKTLYGQIANNFKKIVSYAEWTTSIEPSESSFMSSLIFEKKLYLQYPNAKDDHTW